MKLKGLKLNIQLDLIIILTIFIIFLETRKITLSHTLISFEAKQAKIKRNKHRTHMPIK